MNASHTLSQLKAAVIDGRTENLRYRQNELQKLHATLRENADKILTVIASHGSSRKIGSEAETEYYLTLQAVANFYKSLDFSESLKNEYLIANGADNVDRRVGKGLVILRPTTHTRFYSIICPLAAAISAGNCILLEVS